MSSTHFSIRTPPVWEQIDKVGLQASHFMNEAGVDRESNDAMTMVVCELVENATKYGDFQPANSDIAVAVSLSERAITVEVRNMVRADEDADLHRLDEMIQWIRGYQDPFEAYLERMKEVSMQSLAHRESGLGLVRIAYEGHAILDFVVDETRTLNVSAVRKR